jgi:hypothetical protein
MHGATATAGASGYNTHQFSHRVPGGNSFRQSMTVTAVRAGHIIVYTKLRAHPRGHGFFANVHMNETRHSSTTEDFFGFQFELAD